MSFDKVEKKVDSLLTVLVKRPGTLVFVVAYSVALIIIGSWLGG